MSPRGRRALFAFCALVLLVAGLPVFGAGSEETPMAAAGTAVAATGLPIVKEPITLTFTGMNMNVTRVGRMDETDMMKQLAQLTNVNIIWDLVPQNSWKEKKNLIVASRQLPDGFMGPLSLSAEEIQMFGADGVIVPLDDLLAKYAPAITSIMEEYPSYEPFTRSLDGNIYALTAMQDLGFDSFSASIIRQEWLDKLGLEMPTTTEEFYQVLRAFKENDPAGGGKTIPFSFLYQESPSINREVKREFEWFFLAFGVPDNPKPIAIEDNGQVIFTADKTGYRETIEYLHRLYAEGLLDKEIFTQDRTLLTNKIRQLSVGGYTDYRLKLSMAHEQIQGFFSIMPPLRGPHGDQRWLRGIAGMSEGAFALTSNCKYPEAAVRWVDYINEPENNIQMAYGMFREAGWNKNEALIPSTAQPGKWDVNTGLRPSTVQPSDWPFSSPIAISPILTSAAVINQYLAEKPSNTSKREACEVYRPFLTRYPYNYPYRFTVEEIEDLSLMQTDLLNYIYKTQAKWIAEGGIETEWDGYLAQLKRLKVDEYLALYQRSYARSQR